jgi:hypothetical protein
MIGLKAQHPIDVDESVGIAAQIIEDNDARIENVGIIGRDGNGSVHILERFVPAINLVEHHCTPNE